MKKQRQRKRVLAVSSGGGHWVQLLRLRPTLIECESVFVTVHPSFRADVHDAKFYSVCDATRWDKLRLFRCLIQLCRILLKERPDVVLSTGAAPGYIAIRLGKLIGARTIWVDSIANVEHLSMAGSLVGQHADLWLTQWSHLAKANGPHFHGAVL